MKPGDVVVIRYEGPKGGPGMREMLAITAAIKGAGSGQGRAAADRRAVLRRHHRLCIGHIAPEAVDGGPIAFLRDGDVIRVDIAATHSGPAGRPRRARIPQARLGPLDPSVQARRARQILQARRFGRAGRDHQLRQRFVSRALVRVSTTRWSVHRRCRASCPHRSVGRGRPGGGRRSLHRCGRHPARWPT